MINIAFINNAGCPNRFSFDGHPSASKFLDAKNSASSGGSKGNIEKKRVKDT